MMKKISGKTIEQLMESAKGASKNSYAPYSKIAVGCTVLGKSSNIYTGCNIENMSYSLTICAERIAISKAISEGEKKIIAVAIYTNLEKIFTPCGACREFIKEFASSHLIPIFCSSKSGRMKKFTLKQLLPQPFNFT